MNNPIKKSKQRDNSQTENENLTDIKPLPVKKKNHTRTKIVVFNIINIFLIGAIFYLLNRFTPLALEIQELRANAILAQETSDIAVLESDLERYEDEVRELRDVFITENNYINFISSVEQIKTDEVITVFTPSGNTTTDKDRDVGFTIIFELRGSQEQVGNKLNQIQNLPYIIKPINFEISFTEEGLVVLRYVGLLLSER